MFGNTMDWIKNGGTDNAEKYSKIKYKTIFIALAILFIFTIPAGAWPQEPQWNVVLKNGQPLTDPLGDAQDGKDVVGNATYPCCYFFNNGSALFFRMRVDSTPIHPNGGLKPYGWGMEIDSNANLGDYEWLILIDGIQDPETVTIERNTIQGVIGDPSDQPEFINKTYIPTIGGYVNVSNAGWNFGSTDDYFISWYVPYNDFLSVTGLDNFSAIRVFFGTSSSTHALVPNGADLVNGSDLFSAGSDWVSPMGTVLTNGSIDFVDASYINIVNSVISGDPVYIRVNDSDRNTDNLSIQTLNVTLLSSNGDLLNITLTESGVSSAIFTGSAQTAGSAPVPFDPILQVESPGTINATYNDTNAQGQMALIYDIVDVLAGTNDPPVITLVGSNPVTIEVDSIYTDAGATATDDIDGDITSQIVIVNSVDNTTLGTYTVTYDVTDSSGNHAAQVVRTVYVNDTTPPIITMNGVSPVTVELGSVYNDAGAIAFDNYDGDITSQMVIVNSVDNTTLGTYTVTYDVTDSSGNHAVQVVRTVYVNDNTPPIITMNGVSPVTVELGSVYYDAGATALDDIDGDLTDQIVIVNSVDNTTLGTYTVTYDVTDSSGNHAVQVVRTVYVNDSAPPIITMNGVSPVTVELGSVYYDAGATALDDIDGDLTNQIVIVNSVDNTTVGTYTVTYDVTDSSGNPAVQVVRTVHVNDTTPPVWVPVPSDRIIGYGSNLNYDVNAIDLSPPITYGVNDTTNFTIDSNGLIRNNTVLNTGIYFLNISASDRYGNTAYSIIRVTVKQYSKIYTFDADFDEGTFIGVEHGTVHDQLQLTESVTTFPIMWIANAGEDTVSRWDTDNNKEMARYNTWFGLPASHDAWTGPSPSRTAVDSEGNAYVANRHFDSKPADVIKILAFDYIDRNGNGLMDTSRDLNGDGTITTDEMLPMTDLNGNGIIDDAEIRDERIAWAVSVGPVSGLGRSLAIDNDNNIWLGLFNSKTYYKLSSVNGTILAGPIDVSPNTPYGALVDKNGILWGASLTTSLLKLDTRTNTKLNVYDHSAYGIDYGIALGYDAGDNTHVYLAEPYGNTYIEFNSATGTFSVPAAIKFPTYGIATDSSGNILTSNFTSGPVAKFAPDGSLIWSAAPQLSATARGIVIDSDNNVWVVHTDANKMSKFNGSNGGPLGVFNTGLAPYTYSDATGLSMRSSVTQSGTWTVIHDGGFAGTAWGRASWNGLVPTGAAIEVRVRASETITGLQAAVYQSVTNGNDFSAVGRYIEIETTLKKSPDDISPVLYDLTISQAGSNIMGYVIDSISKAGLQGVLVSTNTGISTISSASGSYSIGVPAGSYTLTAVLDIRYYVNNTVTVIVPLSGDVLQDIELELKPVGTISGSVSEGV